MSKLLWDPSLNQNKLVDTFMHGYYLQAAAEMKKYYELSVRTGKNSTVKIGCGQESTSEWLPLDILFKMRGHLLYALKAAGQNQILIRRISRELVVVNFSILTRALEVSRSKVWKSKVDFKKLYEDTIREADRQGIIGTREGFTTTTELYARLKVMVYGKNNPVHPGMIDGIKNEELLIIPARDFIKRGETSLVKDADAINGAAVQLAKIKNDWSIQVFLPFLPVCKSWEIWAAVKMPYNKNTALTYGYYSYKHRNFKQIEKEIMVNQTKKSGYQLVFLNQLDLSEGNYQVFLGLKNKISSACFIDYFVLKPINNTSK